MLLHQPTVKVSPLLRRPPIVRLLLIALLAEIGYGVLNVSTMPFYLSENRSMGSGVIGLVITAYLLSDALFRGTMGHLADRLGPRRLMVLGPCITIFTPILTIAVPHDSGYIESLTLIMLRVADGIGTAMIWPAAYALVSNTVGEDERQEAMSLLNVCFLLGIALAMPIGGIVNEVFGRYLAGLGGDRTPSLYLASLVFMGIAVAAYLNVPSGRLHRERKQEERATQRANGEGSALRDFVSSLRRIPQFLVLGFLTFMGIGFPLVSIKLFAAQEFRMSETQFGFLVLPSALAMAALSVPMSKLGERMGRVRAVHAGMGLCIAGLVPICMGAVAHPFRSVWIIALGGIPLALGFLLTIPAWYASISESDPSRRAANIGAVMTAQGLGAIVGAPLGGAAYQYLQLVNPHFGRYSPFLGCLACITVAWLIGLRILHEGPSTEPSPDGA